MLFGGSNQDIGVSTWVLERCKLSFRDLIQNPTWYSTILLLLCIMEMIVLGMLGFNPITVSWLLGVVSTLIRDCLGKSVAR